MSPLTIVAILVGWFVLRYIIGLFTGEVEVNNLLLGGRPDLFILATMTSIWVVHLIYRKKPKPPKAAPNGSD